MSTETLRPSAAGDECLIADETGAACPDHYQNVDEAVADDGTTSNWDAHKTDYHRDFYNVDDSGVGAGTINKITVYAKMRANYDAQDCAKICIKSGTGDGAPDTPDEGAAFTPTKDVWDTYNNEWATNPATSAAWTWDEIDKLQIGVAVRSGWSVIANTTYCTQIYVVVDYTEAVTFIPTVMII